MAYQGNAPATAYTSTTKDTFSGDGSTTAFTLSRAATQNAIRVVVANVVQDPGVAYTCSGSTLTFTSAPPSGTNNIYVVHLGPPAATVVPPSTINNATTFTNGVTLKNETAEDTDGGRESTVTFTGTQSGGEISTLAEIEASHDGTADDEKGDLIFRTNDGADGSAPTERLRIDSAGNVGIGVTPYANSLGPSFDLANGPNIFGYNRNTYLTSNLYYDTAWKYKESDDAVYVGLESSSFRFHYAPSGTAGASVTPTEIARFDTDGLKFNGDTAAANALDDYEEGVYTATLTPTTSGSITLNAAVRKLKYTKIGDTVFVQGLLETSSISSPVGSGVKLNLPFTAKGYTGANHYSHRVSDHMYISRVAGVSGSGSYGWAITENDTSNMNIEIDASTVHPSGQYSQFYFHFHYQVA